VETSRAVLRERLTPLGAKVDEIAVYQTVPGRPTLAHYAALRAGIDAIVFTSSITVRNFINLVGPYLEEFTRGAVVACIGPLTAQTARAYGLQVTILSEQSTAQGLFTALEQYFEDPTLENSGSKSK
jgi:uroporphyrinogen-III synthase